MSCVEVFRWPQRPTALRSSNSSNAGTSTSTSVVLRTSGVTTRRLSPCTREYIELLQQEVAGLADLHLLTDLSLTAPDGLSPARLRALADEHERQLERALPGVEALAFSVSDLLREWPGVAWPVPGDPSFRAMSAYDKPTQGWLEYVHRAVRKHGNLSRALPGSAEGRRVSNLVSYRHDYHYYHYYLHNHHYYYYYHYYHY